MKSLNLVESDIFLDSDYQQVEYLLGEQAIQLSPEVRTIIAKAFAIVRKNAKKKLNQQTSQTI